MFHTSEIHDENNPLAILLLIIYFPLASPFALVTIGGTAWLGGRLGMLASELLESKLGILSHVATTLSGAIVFAGISIILLHDMARHRRGQRFLAIVNIALGLPVGALFFLMFFPPKEGMGLVAWSDFLLVDNLICNYKYVLTALFCGLSLSMWHYELRVVRNRSIALWV